jgi:YD repeat-containing protein
VADGATDVGKGNLTPGDSQAIPGITSVVVEGRVSTRAEFDRNSRPTFVVEDDADTSRRLYDGLGRVIQSLDAEGNRVEYAYDDNGNLIETRETDVSQVPGVADELFLTTYFYDSLDRVQRQVNNLGHTIDYRYDSRDNLVAMADAQGPMGGQSITRRAFAGGALTVDGINDFGNVTVFYFDGLGRQVREERFLTASGLGDGLSIGASLEGIKNDPAAPESFPPVVDTAQGGGDGIIRSGTAYDRNSLTTARFDDQGNITLSLYDNLNRQVAEVFGLTEGWPLDHATIFGPRLLVTPTQSTINHPDVIDPVKVDAQLAEAAARIAAAASLFPSLADRVDPPTANIYGYDEEGNLLILEDQNDNEVFQRYDAIDRAIATRVFRSGQVDSHFGDPIFAPDPLSDPSHPSAPFAAIVGTTARDTEYDGLSRLTLATDNNEPLTVGDDSSVTRAYDSLGRLIEETQQVGFLPPRPVDYGWRAENLNFSLTYPNGRVVERTFDLVDRVDKLRDAGQPLPIADYRWIGQDRVLVRAAPVNGTRLTHLDPSGTIDVGYDGVRRPMLVQHLRGDNSLIVGTDSQYDRMDNWIHELKLHDPTNSEISRYDSAYRMVEFQRAGIPPQHSNWQLDGAGNWRQVDAELRQHSSQNEIIQQDGMPLDSDDNGNLNNDREFWFTYDYLNQLRTVTRQSDGLVVAENSYDALGRRIQHVVTHSGPLDTTTNFLYALPPSITDSDQLPIIAYYGISARDLCVAKCSHTVIEERSGTGQVTQQYVWGSLGEPVVLDRNLDGDVTAIGPGDQRLFYHENVLGSIYALTDEVGQIAEGYMYDAYGRQIVFGPGPNGLVEFGGDDLIVTGGHSTMANPYLHVGQRLDAETGLHLNHGRHFHPELGRFLTRAYQMSAPGEDFQDPSTPCDPRDASVDLNDILDTLDAYAQSRQHNPEIDEFFRQRRIPDLPAKGQEAEIQTATVARDEHYFPLPLTSYELFVYAEILYERYLEDPSEDRWMQYTEFSDRAWKVLSAELGAGVPSSWSVDSLFDLCEVPVSQQARTLTKQEEPDPNEFPPNLPPAPGPPPSQPDPQDEMQKILEAKQREWLKRELNKPTKLPFKGKARGVYHKGMRAGTPH